MFYDNSIGIKILNGFLNEKILDSEEITTDFCAGYLLTDIWGFSSGDYITLAISECNTKLYITNYQTREFKTIYI